MKIEEYISELLYDHDCVILPEFGGFVCNYSPARIDPIKHLFEPPSKKILFNKGLTRNDGLLANHVSTKLKVPYSEALSSISKEAKRLKEELHENRQTALDNIGLLYLDNRESILFQQDTKVNYLQDSFGLSAFYRLPVEISSREEKEGKVVPLPDSKTGIYAAAAVFLVLAALAFWLSTFDNKKALKYSNLTIFSRKDAPIYAFSPSGYNSIPAPLFEPFKVVEVAPSLIPVPLTNKPVTLNTSTYYSVIAGGFLIKENAEKLIAQYSKQNVHLFIVCRNPNGLYIVGYGKFQSYNEATEERDKFRRNFIKEAWVKKAD